MCENWAPRNMEYLSWVMMDSLTGRQGVILEGVCGWLNTRAGRGGLGEGMQPCINSCVVMFRDPPGGKS